MILLPKNARKIESGLLIVYPLIWVAIYSMLGSLDVLQLHVYGYVSAEVYLMFLR
jgi:hypothetical protein